MMDVGTDNSRIAKVKALRHRRPKQPFVMGTLVVIGLLVAMAWILGPIDIDNDVSQSSHVFFQVDELFDSDRSKNFERFTDDITPYPVRGREWDWGVVKQWASDLFTTKGADAMLGTLAIAVASVVLAGLFGLIFSFPAARTLSTPDPFLPGGDVSPLRRWKWEAVTWCTRSFLIVMRSIPEYVLAFLLLTLLGQNAWPAVLALAIHNGGILGKLGAEVVENATPASPRAMRSLGSSRKQIAMFSLFPMVMPRFLLYFFYRWETCVREATILGMLGFATLGFLISDARAKSGFDDEMVFYILLGAVLVLAGDMVSFVARWTVRRAS